jgi:hypothetical protein
LHGTARELVVQRNKNTIDYTQHIKALVPFHAVCYAPHRSCPPCPLPVGHSNIESFLFPKDGLETGKVVRPMDWKERYLVLIRSKHDQKVYTSELSCLSTTDSHLGVSRTWAVVMISNRAHRTWVNLTYEFRNMGVFVKRRLKYSTDKSPALAQLPFWGTSIFPQVACKCNSVIILTSILCRSDNG